MNTQTRTCLLSVLLAGPTLAQQVLDPVAEHRRAIQSLERTPNLDYNPYAILVRFAPSADETQRAAIRGMVGAGRIRRYEMVAGLELIETRLEPKVAIARIAPFVLFAEPDWVVRATGTPNDPSFSDQWGCHNVGQSVSGDPGTAGADVDALEAWNSFSGDPNFVVAIIDTGTDFTHPDLADNIWVNPAEIESNGIDDDHNGFVDDVHGWDFFDDDNNPVGTDDHGTHTAGTVGARGNNGVGVAGVNWQCRLMPLRFLGGSSGEGLTSDAVDAIWYCIRMGVKVSNNSWSGGNYSQALYVAINSSKSVGHVFCASAGNDGTNNDSNPKFPGSYNLDNILAVAATDNDDMLASFSNFGATSVDLAAPGVDILSTVPNNGYEFMDGTSMATPHVSGVAALLYGLHPDWSYSQVINRIRNTTRRIPALAGKCTTGGVVNAAAAIGAAVYVDSSYVGPEYGSFDHPFNTVAEGIQAVLQNGSLILKAATYTASPITLPAVSAPKPFFVRALGGSALVK